MTAVTVRRLLVACWLLQSHWVLAAGASQEGSGTLRDLRTRDVEVDSESELVVPAGEVIRQYERVLGLRDADPRLAAEALRRLGDLKLEQDEAVRGEEGALPGDAPRLREAIGIYESLLAQHPDSSRTDMVLYQLARAYEADGRTDDALQVLDRLVADHPQSPRLAEAQFRRGEIHFSAGRYVEAERAYGALVALGSESTFYEQGLYKRGWSLFKQQRSDDSTEAFLVLLDRVLVSTGTLRATTSLSRPEQELVADTFRALAVTFSDLAGPETLDDVVRRRSMPPYGHLLYAALGDLYLEQERFQDAAVAFSAYVEQQPDDRNAPLLQVRAIDAYRTGGFESLVLEGKRDFVERYALTSSFWLARTPQEEPEIAAVLKSNLHDLAQHHHAEAQRSRSAIDFSAAAKWYGAMLDSFPADAEAPENRYLLAEVLFEGGRFAEAAAEYARTAYDYPTHPRSAQAGYASLVASQKQEETLQGAARNQWHRQSIGGGIRFATAFPDHPQAGAVLTKAAEDLFALEAFDESVAISQRVLEFQPPVDARMARSVAGILAHSLFELGRHAEAEQAYVRLQALMPAGDPDQAAITERLAASIYKQAEAKQASGATDAAVEDFLRVATLAPNAKVRATAEFDAATLLIRERQWERATGVLLAFRRAHPGHELEADVTRSLAVTLLESGRALEAAVEFERIAARSDEEVELRRTAQWQAAELYDKGGQSAAAATAYATYVSRHPQPLGAAMDARQRLADLAAAAGDGHSRTRWLEEIVSADQTAGPGRTDRSRYLAAKATLSLAEPSAETFNAIRLVIPLDRSLRTKRAAMEKVLSAYGKALEYQVAEVTTAATFGMAETYRQFAADLMSSDRPADLDDDAREQYDVLLEEQAFPFEEKAIELHQANIARAAEGVYDDWVQRSFETLAKLMPARFAKLEKAEDYVSELR